MAIHKTYIGDGAYAEFDGFNLKLWTPRQDGEHYIYLDPQVWQTLLDFMDQFKLEEMP